MKLDNKEIDNLIAYIEQNEVIYQAIGGMVEISNNDNMESRQSLIDSLSQASSVEVYNKGASFIHEPFEELDNWSTEDDLLFLLEVTGILMCIPRKYAIENKLIND